MNSETLPRLLEKLEDSQWWPEARLVEYQLQQLRRIVQHAHAHIPGYRDRLEQSGLTPDGPLTAETWRQLPVLTRFDLQEAGSALHSPVVPQGHGPVARQLTGGSTGTPVETLATVVTSLFWRAATIRDHRWHQRDLSKTLAAIRQVPADCGNPPDGLRLSNWGSATKGHYETGPGLILSIFSTTAEQAEWLVREDPQYLMTYPSALEALAEHFVRSGQQLSNLCEVRTFGEVLDAGVRDACRRVWNVPLVDAYSCQETGYIALQCPEHDHYHVQSEDLLVEVLNDDNRPCEAGETGRVVITTLHNYAMPLLRYEIGDYAEVGQPCSCGRGLPVLNRIVGRSRNMFLLPDGNRVWPSLEASEYPELEGWPVRQYQVVQRDPGHVDAYLVALRELTPDEQALTTRAFHKAVRHPFDVTYHYVEKIERSPSGKYEEFRSNIS